RVRWELVDILVSVVSHVVRAHDNVADVAQQFAVGSPDNFRKEFGFLDCRWTKSDVASRILNQVWTAQTILNVIHMVSEHPKSLFVVLKRQQVVEVLLAISGPSEMPRDENRIDRLDQGTNSSQVLLVNSARASDGNADGMHGNRKVCSELREDFVS